MTQWYLLVIFLVVNIIGLMPMGRRLHAIERRLDILERSIKIQDEINRHTAKKIHKTKKK